MNNKYFLLRHGETVYQTQKENLLYPWPDLITDLTKKGKKQAEAIAEKLKRKKIDLIYSSDFLRARQTAEIVAKELGSRIYFDKRLRDINWGIYQGRPKENYQQFFSSQREAFFKRAPRGECWNDVKERMLEVVKDIEKKYKNKTILIVSHGDPLWLLFGTLKGFNEKQLLAVRHNKNFYPAVGQYLQQMY